MSGAILSGRGSYAIFRGHYEKENFDFIGIYCVCMCAYAANPIL